MKKLYVSLFSLAIAFGANAQKSTDVVTNRQVNTDKQANRELNQSSVQRGGGLNCPFVEGFDAAFPATWSQVVTNTGASNTTWYWSATAGNPDGGMDITYDANLDNQLESITTSVIDLSAIPTPGLYFDWFMSYYWAVDPNDNYDLTVAISTNGGTSWTDLWTEADAGEFETFVYQTKVIDLSAYASETTATFRFTYEGNDGAQASLDNINVCSLPATDMALNYVYPGDVVNDYIYTKIPVAQAVEVIAGFIVQNAGVSTLTNVEVDWSVSLAGSSVATGTAVGPASSAPGQVDTIWVSTGYTPSAEGMFSVEGTVSTTELDENGTNNSGAAEFEVTQFVWAHDYENESYGTAGYAASEPDGALGFQMGARFFAQNGAGTIHGVNFALASTTTATSVIVNIYENSTTDAAVSTTVYDILPGDLSTTTANFITVPLNDPVQITAGSVYIATIEVQAGDDAFMLSNGTDDNDGAQALYLGSDDAWYNWIGLTTTMRLNLNPNVGISENQDLTGIQMFPNPANDMLTVKFNANESNDIRVNVIGMDGKMVYSQSVNAFSGQFTSRISLEGVANGLYSVQVISDNTTFTQKVAVVK
jgi:hypothetical protein